MNRPRDTNPPRDDQERTHDQKLARILADYCERLQAGETLDVEKIVADHPDLAPDLRIALEAVGALADDVGGAVERVNGHDQNLNSVRSGEMPDLG